MKQPSVLNDTTVVEITQTLAGALCGRLLVELGANVVLIEPATGHAIRALDDDGHLFSAVATGKRSVAVGGQNDGTVRDIVGGVDVVITDETEWAKDTARPVVETNESGVISCSVTPFGQGRSSAKSPDPIVQAESGITGTSGFPGQLPASTGIPIASTVGAFIGCGSVLAKIYSDSNGRIDISAQDAILPLLTTFIPEYFVNGDPIEPPGNHHPNVAPWNAYRAKDDWVFFIALTDDEWDNFIEMTGRDDLRGDPRFSSTQHRRKNVDQIDEIVSDWIAQHTLEEVIDHATANGLTAAPILTVPEAFDHENSQYRGMSVRSRGSQMAGSVFKLSKTPGQVPASSPEFSGRQDL